MTASAHYKRSASGWRGKSSRDITRVFRWIKALHVASAGLSRRVGMVVAYPPLSEMSDLQRLEFHEALLDADAFEDLPEKWPATILEAEADRPNLRIVGGG